MLKPLLFLVAVLFTLSSCKKQYTCSCNTVVVYSDASNKFYTQTFFGGIKTYSEKLNKKQAKDACSHTEGAIQTNVTNWYTINGKYPLKAGESIVTSCNINL